MHQQNEDVTYALNLARPDSSDATHASLHAQQACRHRQQALHEGPATSKRTPVRQRRTRWHPTWPAKHTPLSAGGWVVLVWLSLRPTSARNWTFPQTNGRQLRPRARPIGPWRLDPPALDKSVLFRRLVLTNATPSR